MNTHCQQCGKPLEPAQISRQQDYCSHHCSRLAVWAKWRAEGGKRGGPARSIVLKVQGLSPEEAYRLGWHQSYSAHYSRLLPMAQPGQRGNA